MALSGTIYGSTNNEWIDAKLEWSATQSIANNTSTITATLYYIRTNTGYTTHGNLRGSISIDGKSFSSVKEIWITETHWEEAAEVKYTVSHNSDGTKSTTISATGYINNTSLDSTSLSGVITLDTIHRKAAIVSAPNFNDEGNPTITYTNPAGSNMTTLQACISLTGAADDVAYRDISKTGTSYTFNLTTAERNTLRQATSGKSRTVRFYVKSIIGGVSTLDYLEKTLTITNAAPTINPTITDTNATTKALTGDANKLVRYYSNAAITIGAAGQKYATIKSQKVSNGSKSLTANGTINAVESGSFVFSATDSRGYSTTKTVNKTFINYIKPTCDIGNNMPSADGSYTLNVKGNYFNGSFGAVSNTLTVYYRYKANDGAYTSWTAATATASGNTYTAAATITGLDYQTTYTFQAYIVDKLNTVYSAEKAVKSTPVFDWGKDDFNVNGSFGLRGKTVLRNNGDNNNIILSSDGATDGVFIRPNGTGSNEGQAIFKKNGELSLAGGLSVNGMEFGKNKVLWSGGYIMSSGHTITLSEPVSEQVSGIILVFSQYNVSTGEAVNSNFSYHFVPKQIVALHGGASSTFFMSRVNFSFMACKVLYIGDTQIKGHDLNQSIDIVDSTTGFEYANTSYVLRYVIGV